MGPGVARSSARRGAVWRGAVLPWRAVRVPRLSLSLSIPRALRNALVAALRCVVALCRQSVAVAAPVRWDCAIGRVSKIEI